MYVLYRGRLLQKNNILINNNNKHNNLENTTRERLKNNNKLLTKIYRYCTCTCDQTTKRKKEIYSLAGGWANFVLSLPRYFNITSSCGTWFRTAAANVTNDGEDEEEEEEEEAVAESATIASRQDG